MRTTFNKDDRNLTIMVIIITIASILYFMRGGF